MKTRVLKIVAVITSLMLFTSCEDDEVEISKPVIGELELGIDNSHIAYIGSDMHMQVELLAEGKIDLITIEIHKEDGTGDEIEAEFTKYAGQKNGTFHEHIDIPAGTAAGEYHFHMTVIDQLGNSTTVEEEITLEVSTDTDGPAINVSDSPDENEEFSVGQQISISGKVTDDNTIGGIVIALVRAGGSEEPEDVIIMHLEYYEDEDEIDFAATINAGSEYDNQETPELIEGDNAWQSADYYILVRAWDAFGNTTNSQQYPVKVSL